MQLLIAETVGINIKLMLKKILALSMFSFLFANGQKKTENYIDLGKLIIEVNDENQIKSLEKKIDQYFKDRNTVFMGQEYYYDTSDKKKYVVRGGGKFIESTIHWFLVIDNFNSNDYLFELDWKPDLETIRWGIEKLASKKGYEIPEFNVDADYSGLDTGGILKKYNEILIKKGYTLIYLDIDSDSYVTALIQSKNSSKVIDKGNELNHKIRKY